MAESSPGIRHTLLQWGRESRGFSLDDVASRLKLKPGALESWERGEATPTLSQLRRLAKLYRRSVAFFFLPAPPRTPPELPDYRRTARKNQALSPELRLEIRRAAYRRRVSLALIGLAETPRIPEASPASSPDVTARLLRETLGVSLERQVDAGDQYAALALWIDAVEALGAMVFHASHVSIDEVRGFSLAAVALPVIVLNGADSARARSFTLLHELAHLAFRMGGLCDLEGGGQKEQSIEPLCNRVAAATLIPVDDFLESSADASSAEDVRALANRYWVSSEVVLLRLLSLRQIEEAEHERLLAEIRASYPERKGSGGNYYRTLTRNNGYRYSALVLDALAREAITPLESARYLGAKLEHLDRVASLLEHRDIVQQARV